MRLLTISKGTIRLVSFCGFEVSFPPRAGRFFVMSRRRTLMLIVSVLPAYPISFHHSCAGLTAQARCTAGKVRPRRASWDRQLSPQQHRKALNLNPVFAGDGDLGLWWESRLLGCCLPNTDQPDTMVAIHHQNVPTTLKRPSQRRVLRRSARCVRLSYAGSETPIDVRR